MVKSNSRSRPRRRAAWTAILGGLSLSLAACQDAVAPSGSGRAAAPESALRSTGQADARIPDQYIVTFSDQVVDVPGLAKQLVAQSNGTIGFTYQNVVRGFSARLSTQAVAALENNPNIELIEPDQSVQAAGVQSPAPWWLDRLDQRTATLDNSYSFSSDGTGVTVYILDSGILIGHADFEGRASYGYDFINNTSSADDCNGHGTHMAGSVGGKTYGVAKGVRLVSVRVLDCGGAGSTSALIAGLDWVAAHHTSLSVANLSLSGPVSSTVNQAVANLIAAGVTVAAAAGDGGYDACQSSPASAPGAITAGASLTQYGADYALSFSNYGSCVDLFAPGYQIISDWNNGSTWLLTGTSPSSALVAGAAAAYLAGHTSASPADVANAVIGSATTGTLSGLIGSSPNRLLYVGFDGSSPPPPPPPPPPADTGTTPVTNAAPVASFSVSCQKGNCSFDASSSTDDSGIVNYAWSFGDGGSASSSSPLTNHTYTTKGNYTVTVTLTVTDAAGLTGRTQTSVAIRNKGK